MTTRTRRPARTLRSLAIALPALASLLVSPSAHGATHTWSGGVDDTWSKAGNWVGGVAPASVESNVDLVFPAAGAHKATSNDVAGLTIQTITISDGPYTLTGLPFTLVGGLTVEGGASVNVVVDNDIVLGGNVLFSVESGLAVKLDGALSGSFGFQVESVGGETGQLLLQQPSTFSGPVSITTGYLIVKDEKALGAADGTAATGTTVGPFASLGLYAAISGERLELSGEGANGNGTVQSYAASASWSGPVVLTGDAILTALGFPLTVSGPISGPFGLDFRANAGVTLAGTNSYSGASRVQYGVVYANGSHSGSAWYTRHCPGCTGGTLGGTGTIGPVTVEAGGGEQLRPGAASGASGVLTTGALSMSGGVLGIDLRGTTPGGPNGYDQVNVTGAVSLGSASLQVALGGGFVPSAGQTFTIVANDGTDLPLGTFFNLPQGSTFQVSGNPFQISYTGGDGNDVVLRALGGGPALQVPVFTPASSLTRTKGTGATSGLLGTVSDADTPLANLQVSLVNAFTGAQVSGLSLDGAGNVTASVGVDCATPVVNGGINLFVTDGFLGVTGAASVVVASDGPPAVTPPNPVTVDQTACVGGQPGTTLARLQTRYPTQYTLLDGFVNGGSATDVCTTSPTRLTAQLSGSSISSTTLFPVGTSPVTFRFQDASSEIGTAQAGVTVRRQGDVNLDGIVDVFDLVGEASLIVGNVTAGVAPYQAPLQVGDADADGDVDVFDLVLISAFIVGNSTCLTP